ncbi:hypothetical protein AB3X96_39230, partial [Paraburkholderia sp. BR13439]|uniref:hypothetical protein n=1 Tax=Paraburkholderia sp. BR13439 TaxID=3236996 RepID=UPI0034CF9E77
IVMGLFMVHLVVRKKTARRFARRCARQFARATTDSKVPDIPSLVSISFFIARLSAFSEVGREFP